MKKTIFLFFSFVVLASAARAPKLQKLRVYLDWISNVEFAGMYTAEEQGLYTKRGLKVERIFKDLSIIERVCNKEAEVGLVSAHDLFDVKKNYCGAKAFAAKYQLNPNSIVVPMSSKIKSIKNLKGKRLGVFSTNETNMYRAMLSYHGLTLEDVTLVEVDTFDESEIIELFKKNKIDAIIAWEFNWTITFSLLKFPVRVFPGYENGLNFYGIVYIARADTLEKQSDLLVKFLESTFEGWRMVYKNPVKVADHVVKNYYPSDRYINKSRELTLKQQKAELVLRKRYFLHGTDLLHIGVMNDLRWQQSFDVAKETGFLTFKNNPQPQQFYTKAIIQRLYPQ